MKHGKKYNESLKLVEPGKLYDVIAGTFFLCGCPPDEDSFTGLTEEQVARYTELFREPEAFLRVGNDVIALPTQWKGASE